MLNVIDLEHRRSHKQHFEHDRLRKPLPNVLVTDVQQTQESNKVNDGFDVRKQETLVEEAMESNDSFESIPKRCQRYRPPEEFFHGGSKGFVIETKTWTKLIRSGYIYLDVPCTLVITLVSRVYGLLIKIYSNNYFG